MTTVTVKFSRIHQDRQDVGGPEEQMVSTVYFEVHAGGRSWPSLEANVKQTAGASYVDAPLEVELPVGYDGPMNYNAFRDCVETYYRAAVGQGGRMFNFGPETQARMRDNVLVFPQECSFEAG